MRTSLAVFGLLVIAVLLNGCLLNHDFPVPGLSFDADLPEFDLSGSGRAAEITANDGFSERPVDVTGDPEVAATLDALRTVNSASVSARVWNPIGEPALVRVYVADEGGLTADAVAALADELLSFQVNGGADAQRVTQLLDAETLAVINELLDQEDPNFTIYVLADTGNGQPVPVTIRELKLKMNVTLGLGHTRSLAQPAAQEWEIDLLG